MSDTNDITNVKQPDFLGTSEPFSNVSLYATPLSGGTATLIGQGQAASDGAWNIVSSVPLTDGSYKITATAIDQFGETTTVAPIVITADLVIDTVGPVITALSFVRGHGVVNYTIQDPAPGSGIWVNTLLDSSNYLLTKVHANKAYPGKWIVTNITVTPIGNNSYNVSVVFNSGKYIRGGYLPVHHPRLEQWQLVDSGHRRQSFGRRISTGRSRRATAYRAPISWRCSSATTTRSSRLERSSARRAPPTAESAGHPLASIPSIARARSAGAIVGKDRAGEKDRHATPQKVTRREKLAVRVESIRTLGGGSLLAEHRTHDEALAALAGEAATRRGHG